ncbi:cysteine peptidase family C39 domain-containing protein [Streptococcus parauberis]|nr:cysteine peptidase family C39 domain-containing protein [Streptococcus parauberis]KYP17069.1 Peptidase C39 family protein [Streptococcus parauberis]KYP17297.1 Peptidase C39 family protein [Streptococcus parauberis]KYP17302.1 Peptidase C39 family protein [Streptococcus parauberis]KYP23987.1 Peptidase C39 family protein [Streptococcus parauberis]KYP25524.1 Peptidase C39 family protein [Streptococcus parauberis]
MTIEHHKQVSLLDCGLACTKTLLSFFEISSENINESFNVKSTQGMSLLDIENVLKKYNISSNSYKIDDIKSLRLKRQHFSEQFL